MNIEEALHQELISSGIEERVSVNQRALIDKLLARYKGEFTVFRELLQNADDAKATTVNIRLIVNNRSQKLLVVQNDGLPFSEDDWKRLIKIAEGNPNEEAVGQFGVGFYSAWSISENPIVCSGDKNLVFVWKNDQLTTFRNSTHHSELLASFSNPNEINWTHFLFPLLDRKWMPDTEKLCRFLIQTLAFTRHIQTVQFFIDSNLIFSTTRTTLSTKAVSLSKTRKNYRTPNDLFSLASVERKELEFKVAGDISETVTMEHVEGVLNVIPDQEVEQQMTRVLGKRFPKQTRVRLLFQTFDDKPEEESTVIEPEPEEELKQDASAVSLMNDLTPFPEKGRIFIGFSSHQSTGTGFHVNAQLIPTVERENIDFNDAYFKRWNSDLISMAGYISRMHYDHHMGAAEKTNNNPGNPKPIANKLLKLMQSFPFMKSTPATEVSELLCSAFLKLSEAIVIPSTLGTCRSQDVYLPFYGMEQFLQVPLVPKSIAKDKLISSFLDVLQRFSLVKQLSFKTFLEHLQLQYFTEDQLVTLLEWFTEGFYNGEKALASELKKGKKAFIDQIRFKSGNTLRHLKTIKYYADHDLEGLPMPETVLPFSLAKRFTNEKLSRDPLQLSKLPFMEFWSFIENHSAFEGPETSIIILSYTAKKWNSLSPRECAEIVETVETKRCILTEDTKKPMKKPSEAYLPQVTLFEDLSFVSEKLCERVSTKFLKDIGVRASPDVKLVFARLSELDWDIKKLVDFLVNNEQSLTEDDWNFLRSAKFLPTQGIPPTSPNYKASAPCLHLPEEEVFEKLGVPVLAWNGKLTIIEKTFLNQIGVKEHPTLPNILAKCASVDTALQEIAFDYFMKHFDTAYKQEYKKKECNVTFIPTINGLSAPANCFHDPISNKYSKEEAKSLCDYLGCYEVLPEFQKRVHRLGVPDHVPVSHIVTKLCNRPPTTVALAALVFDYTSKYQSEITPDRWKALRSASFIPYQNGHLAPNRIFLPNAEVQKKYGQLLDYIDEGYSQSAKNFLKACGVNEVPTPTSLAESLAKNHRRYLLSAGPQQYLWTLNDLAVSFEQLSLPLKTYLKDAPLMLGISTVGTDESKKKEGENDQFAAAQLCCARDCYLIDNTDYQRVFKLVSAPSISPELDHMYEQLGSPWLTSRIKEKCTEVGQGKFTERAKDVQELILQRKGFLLNDINTCRARENLKKNASSLIENLNILEVKQIKKELTLGKQRRELNTSICTKELVGNAATIYITHSVDELSLASELSSLLLMKKGKEDTLKFSALLQTSIASLRGQGYPIDRLLPATKPIVPPAVTPPKEPETKDVADDKPTTVETKTKQASRNDELTVASRNLQNGTPDTSGPVTRNVTDFKQLKPLIDKAINKPPQSIGTTIKEIGGEIIETRCEIQHDRELTKVGQTKSGIAIYTEVSVSMTSEYSTMAEEFARLLLDLVQVFGVKKPAEALNIFLDNKSGTIAYNVNGSIHFNLIYYEKLHYRTVDPKSLDAYFFWYMTFAHELAHNIVQSHGADHSFYTELIATNFFKNFYAKLAELNKFNDNSQPSDTSIWSVFKGKVW